MSKFSLLFPFLKLCLTDTGKVLKNLYSFTNNTVCMKHVINRYGLNNGLPTVDILELFPNFETKIDNYSYLDGTSHVTDIAIVKLLAQQFPDGKYIEFGTWRGESIANVAPVINEAYSISFSEQEMKSINSPETVIRATRFFSKNIPNTVNIEHNSQTYDFTNLHKKFDLIFVDADHQYPGVTIDTRNAFKLLKDESSIIVWHDCCLSFEEPNWQVLRGIMDGAPDDARNKICHISNSLCAIYLNKKMHPSFPEKNIPNKTFSIHLKANKI